MRKIKFIRTILFVITLLIVWGESADAQLPAEGVRLSFYGCESEAIGFFDSAFNDTIRLWYAGTMGPEHEGCPYYFGYLSKGHLNLGYDDLPDTRINCPQVPCTDCDYQITATLTGPGKELVVGDVQGGCCDQDAKLSGSLWQGFKPNDFTHLRIEVDAQAPHLKCPEEHLIKIRWIKIQVPVQTTSWGRLKSSFQTD